MIKKLLFFILFILMLLSGLFSFMLCTETGARYAISFIKKSVPGRLSLSLVSGALTGPIKLQSIRYENKDIFFSAASLKFDLAAQDLLRGRLHFLQFKADKLALNIFSGNDKKKNTSVQDRNMAIPFEIIMDKAELNGFSLCIDNKPSCLKAKEISIKASIKDEEWRIHAGLNGFHIFDNDKEWINGDMFFNLDGLPREYRASLKGRVVSGAFSEESHIEIAGHGSTKNFEVDKLSMSSQPGEITGHGRINWAEKFSVNASVNAKDIDTGVFSPEFRGKLDLEGDISFLSLPGTGGHLFSTKGLRGRIDDYPFNLVLKAKWEQGLFHIAHLELLSGPSYFRAKGTAGKDNNLEWKMDIKKLAAFVPSGKGAITGHGELKGHGKDLMIKGVLKGEKIKVYKYRADYISMDMDLFMSNQKKSSFNVKTAQLAVDDHEIDRLELKWSGSLSNHLLTFSMRAPRADFSIEAKGSYDSSSWKGAIEKTNFFEDHAGRWFQTKSSKLQIFRDHARLERLCLKADKAGFCLDATWRKDKGWEVNSVATKLPLEKLKLNKNVKWKGTIDGSFYLSGEGNNIKTARANISSGESMFTYTPFETEIQSVNIKSLGAEGELKDRAFNAKMKLELAHKNHAKLFVRLSPFDYKASPDTWEISQGKIEAHFNDLTLFAHLLPEIAHLKGVVMANIVPGGMVARPVFSGFISLEKGSFFVPDLGIHMKDISFEVSGEKKHELSLNGSATSGKGSMKINGKIDLSDAGPAGRINITGDHVETAHLPWLSAVASPHLELNYQKNFLKISGDINIPEAKIAPEDLSGTILPSKDVIIMNGEKRGRPEKERFGFVSNVKLILGENIYFKGFGVEGKLKGALSIEDKPDKPVCGTGEINLADGFYRAYGTVLSIEHGKLIFAGGPVNNPGIEARVIKQSGNVLSGLKLAGQLKNPDVTIFSDPPMSQAESLSYLMFGRPLQRLSKGNGKELYGFASSLLLKKGDGNLLGRDIASRLGLEEAKISSDAGIEETSIFIGKYLSPSLYIRYGIGLFSPETSIKLFYHINKNLRFETEAGTSFSGADLIYSIEK